MEKIKVNNISKIFGKNPEKVFPLIKEGLSKDEILDKTGNTIGVSNTNFSIKEAEIFVIMGLSGSGKSTLLRCINRLVEPTRGEIIIDGTNLMDLDKKSLRQYRREKFGMVFQHFALFPNRTVIENVEFGLEIQNISGKERSKRAKETLTKVGLEGWEDQYPDQLSGGMKQRVGLARALAVDPDILLMDEPFSALDPLIKKEMQDKLLDLYDDMQKTIVFITHDLDEALKLGDRIAIMKGGKIIQFGSHEEILTNSKNEYVKNFVQDVNRSRVFLAEDIMTNPIALLYENEGPYTAMHKMRKNELESLFVVDNKRRLKGVIIIEDILEAINKSTDDIDKIIKKTDVAYPDENLDELFKQIANLNTPLPVINDNHKLLGVIVKTNVLANLATEEII